MTTKDVQRPQKTKRMAARGKAPKSRGTVYDAAALFLASALILVGLGMIIMGDPRSDYAISAGIAIQVLYMVLRAPKLFKD